MGVTTPLIFTLWYAVVWLNDYQSPVSLYDYLNTFLLFSTCSQYQLRDFGESPSWVATLDNSTSYVLCGFDESPSWVATLDNSTSYVLFCHVSILVCSCQNVMFLCESPDYTMFLV